MALLPKECKSNCFIWKVNEPEYKGVKSPMFTVHSRQFYLNYSKYKGCYTLFMESVPAGASMPFSVTVHVKNVNGLIPQFSYYRRSDHKAYDYAIIIWKFGESEILKTVPDFLTNSWLTFLCYFDLTDKAIKPLKEDKSVQVVKEPADDKSVQTCSYINNTACHESLTEDLSKLLDHGSHADVTMVCGDRSARLHKIILSTRSDVFSTMLQSDMSEGRTGLIQVCDLQPEIFDHFVRYLYTGKLPDLTADVARRLYAVADKYAVGGLKKRCVHFLEENLDAQNACEMLILADAHSDGEFKENLMEYILQKKICLQDDQWLPFCKDQPTLAIEVLNRSYKMQIK